MKETVKTNQEIGKYSHIFYISPYGSDSNDGHKLSPFRTYNQALSVANDNDCIFFLPGIFIMHPISIKIHTKNSRSPLLLQDYVDVYFGSDKKVDIFGSGRSTKLYIDQSMSSKRDTGVVSFTDQCLISSMQIKFKLRPSQTNYNVPIFHFCTCTFSNVYFKNLNETMVSFAYNNDSSDLTLRNCEFNIGKSILSNYTSAPTYIYCRFNVLPTKGNMIKCEIIEKNKFLEFKRNIGVYSGKLAWEGTPIFQHSLRWIIEVNEIIHFGTSNQGIEYFSKDPNIAKVDEDGRVTGISEGTTQIGFKKQMITKYENITVVEPFDIHLILKVGQAVNFVSKKVTGITSTNESVINIIGNQIQGISEGVAKIVESANPENIKIIQVIS
jgi:hypothetical protein